jgi:bacteriophage HK97-gp10 putative tail-component
VTNVNDLHSEILRQLEAYTAEVAEGLKELQTTTAKELVKDLKATSPEDTGSYKKGWRIKRQRKSLIVHNATDYQLTHLLEHGHAKRGGGRVPAKIHIAPAEEKMIHQYLDDIEGLISP